MGRVERIEGTAWSSDGFIFFVLVLIVVPKRGEGFPLIKVSSSGKPQDMPDL